MLDTLMDGPLVIIVFVPGCAAATDLRELQPYVGTCLRGGYGMLFIFVNIVHII